MRESLCVCAEVRVTKTKCATYKDPWGQWGNIHPVKCFSDLHHTHTFFIQKKTMNWSLSHLSNFFFWSENIHPFIHYKPVLTV